MRKEFCFPPISAQSAKYAAVSSSWPCDRERGSEPPGLVTQPSSTKYESSCPEISRLCLELEVCPVSNDKAIMSVVSPVSGVLAEMKNLSSRPGPTHAVSNAPHRAVVVYLNDISFFAWLHLAGLSCVSLGHIRPSSSSAGTLVIGLFAEVPMCNTTKHSRRAPASSGMKRRLPSKRFFSHSKPTTERRLVLLT